jgi:hypothetical protein
MSTQAFFLPVDVWISSVQLHVEPTEHSTQLHLLTLDVIDLILQHSLCSGGPYLLDMI